MKPPACIYIYTFLFFFTHVLQTDNGRPRRRAPRASFIFFSRFLFPFLFFVVPTPADDMEDERPIGPSGRRRGAAAGAPRTVLICWLVFPTLVQWAMMP